MADRNDLGKVGFVRDKIQSAKLAGFYLRLFMLGPLPATLAILGHCQFLRDGFDIAPRVVITAFTDGTDQLDQVFLGHINLKNNYLYSIQPLILIPDISGSVIQITNDRQTGG